MRRKKKATAADVGTLSPSFGILCAAKYYLLCRPPRVQATLSMLFSGPVYMYARVASVAQQLSESGHNSQPPSVFVDYYCNYSILLYARKQANFSPSIPQGVRESLAQPSPSLVRVECTRGDTT